MNKNKRLQNIQKKLKQYVDNYKKIIRNTKKSTKKIEKTTNKIWLKNMTYFKIIVSTLVFLVVVFFVSNSFLKKDVIETIDSKTNKNTIIKINEKLIDNTLYLNNESHKLLSVSITNIWWESINLINETNSTIKKLDINYCSLKLTDYTKELDVLTTNETTLNRWETSELFFELNSNDYNDSWMMEIYLNCSKNLKTNEKYSSKINFDYKKIYLKEKNILLLNTTLIPIAKEFSNFYKIYSNDWNKVKYMSSIFRSDLRSYKDLDLTNKVVFYYKSWLENRDLFKSMYDEIKKIPTLDYINWYEALELNDDNIKKLYFLWDCENMEKKCYPYTDFENLNIYYNYFSPKMLNNAENNIDYTILIPSQFN